MKSAIKEWLDSCIEKLNAGELTETDLRSVTTALSPKKATYPLSLFQINEFTLTAWRMGVV